MQLRKIYYLMLIIPLLFFYTGCSDDDPTDPPVTVNEAEVLATYLEANGDPVNTCDKNVLASDVNTMIATAADHYLIDIRTAQDYNNGHIQGAVNVVASEVLNHYEAGNLKNKPDGNVVIICYSGQEAGWVNGLLHTIGYTNSRYLKWGMCSWNDATADAWKNSISNSKANDFVTTATAKPAPGDLPKLETGKTDPQEILRVRVEAVFAEGFSAAATTSSIVYADLSAYFILNYWSEEDYNWGHIDGAMQYTQKSSLNLDTYLKTIATDKPVAVYCYSGQTAANVSAYLRVLGYDAKSIKYGVNGMSYDDMPRSKWSDDFIYSFELVQ